MADDDIIFTPDTPDLTPIDGELEDEFDHILRTVNDAKEEGQQAAAFFNTVRWLGEDIALELTTQWIKAVFGEEDE